MKSRSPDEIGRTVMTDVASSEAEVSRIKAVYATRKHIVPEGRYSYFNPGHLFFIQERERRMLLLLRRNGYQQLDTKKILEVGCGTGYWLREFIKWGAHPENVAGVDLLHDRITEAKHLCPDAMRIQWGNAAKLEFPDATFDLVLQSLVFTSVLDPGVKQQIASEMLRVMKPDGLILWYDFYISNPRNPNVRGVDWKEIYRLFPGYQIHLERVTLAPPVARRIVPYSWILAYMLEKIPLLCTHYLGVIRKQQ